MTIKTLPAAIVLAAAAFTVPAIADDAEQIARISVSGQGTTDVAADMAILTLSVVRQADTAREALSANNDAMTEVLAAMADAGIEERDLQTSNFSINPRYENRRSNDGSYRDPKIIGYSVQNTLSVRVRDLDALGAIIDQSVTLGVNQGGSIMFTNDDPSGALEQARIAAMQDAMNKAKVLTETAGAAVGRILEISEHSKRPRPMPMARAEMAMVSDAPAVPIASGENTYSVTVNVTFEIDQ